MRQHAVAVELLPGMSRLDGGVYRLRDGDLGDAGTFANLVAAMRAAERMMDGRL